MQHHDCPPNKGLSTSSYIPIGWEFCVVVIDRKLSLAKRNNILLCIPLLPENTIIWFLVKPEHLCVLLFTLQKAWCNWKSQRLWFNMFCYSHSDFIRWNTRCSCYHLAVKLVSDWYVLTSVGFISSRVGFINLLLVSKYLLFHIPSLIYALLWFSAHSIFLLF